MSDADARSPDPVTGVTPPTLEEEKRYGRLAAVSAALSIVALIATIIVGNASTASRSSGGGTVKAGSKQDKFNQLADFHSSPTGQVAAAVLHSASLLLGIGMALFLFWLVRGRGAPPHRWLLAVSIAGPILVAFATIYGFFAIKHVSDVFFASGVHSGSAAPARASKMLDDSTAATITVPLNAITRIVFAVSVGMLSYYAMRLELLPKFLGYLGVVAAVFFPLSQIGDALYIGWLASVGFMAGGWWPGGRPPAWDIPPDTAGPMPAAGV